MTRPRGRPMGEAQHLTPEAQHRLDEVAREWWTGRNTGKRDRTRTAALSRDWRVAYLTLLHNRDPVLAP
jgi:hypothetical protein